MALSVGGGHVGGDDCVCVGVCALTCINVPVFVRIEDISLNPDPSIQKKKEKKKDIHKQKLGW